MDQVYFTDNLKIRAVTCDDATQIERYISDKDIQSPHSNFSSYTYRCVFIRHGESEWNQDNKFTGWTDVELTELGKIEAARAGTILKENGYEFDIVFTSVLTRAVQTYHLVADSLSCVHLPVVQSWRLNERHYGALQGFNKAETAIKHGKQLVKLWRRSYDVPPPPLQENDERHPRNDPRYRYLPRAVLPPSESLKQTVDRVLPFWYDSIATAILQKKKPLVVGHANSLRALFKHLDKISDEDIINLFIPTGIPLVYEFDKDLHPVKRYYLGDEKELKRKMDILVAQGTFK